MTDEQILEIAHRFCNKYKHTEPDKYRFTDSGVIDFVRRIQSELRTYSMFDDQEQLF